MLQPQITAASEVTFIPYPQADYHTPWSMKIKRSLPSQLLSMTLPLQPSSVPFQRGHLHVWVILQMTTHKHAPKQASSYKNLQESLIGHHNNYSLLSKIIASEIGAGEGSGISKDTVSLSTKSYRANSLFPFQNKACQTLPVYRGDQQGRSTPFLSSYQARCRKALSSAQPFCRAGLIQTNQQDLSHSSSCINITF